ncbi:hypothetical protein [Streptomyces xanthii]|uniref:Uncharacterized protein n=1 Tax=Streptomyces xanthii TaxID=2768069 RepID=A0A7H1B1P1_9ACTN|nr:hypothetical protein [Streptomyces xanthii]QNS02646.1 hypothetical protein IAG42_02770 [Streptomyces xanthii]
MSDLLGAAEHLGSGRHVRAVVRWVVGREQLGLGRVRDIPFVDHGRTGDIRP